MSLSLQATKRRIASVNSTKKITKAMQLVATAKLKSLKKNLDSTRAFASEVSLTMASLFSRVEKEDLEQIFEVKGESNQVVHIVVSSSLGLCGGYNYNLFKEALKAIDKENDLVIVLGTKAASFFSNRSYHVDTRYVDILSSLNYKEVDDLGKYLMYLYNTGKCKSIKLHYTSYKNQITFIPTSYDLFPFNESDFAGNISKKEANMLIEPTPVEVIKLALPLYLKSVLFARLNESILSEYASRRNAMESATDNAEEIVNKLNIEFNKARQAAITQEITEVVGGANAQN